MRFFYIIPILLGFISCENDVVPKPNAYLSLSYQKPNYKVLNTTTPYNFEISNQAVFTVEKSNWANIHYPKLKADINLTYQNVDKNIYQLIADAEKLTYKHTLKAEHIEVLPFENYDKKIYARIFEISGDAASPIQFQVTDSVKNFISGSLYFDVSPNYDSILPAISFVKKDIKHLIETLEWEN
ncbi:gliding motility lipoprotein GldD [Wenyingzhuangia sp. 2_MG-2023]|uniref:gliding motility lipoprotein GldD n=1 Tax=Wenyingzhuangia sp. 2_MG-2023 TaxID=3062639 RepID=UPI0026E448F5|nr:gliding motility lipoprotein GldD [Wenyingzhuangia sp. 2_MG-2023]MDO6736616.1 gliding motility lipoprotein GldD [Wenyingzhuangia sp. 2_MG-2023]MDO6801089.1 gliding motility lipoprotein GldD [Wenyingzhuangia sp. 1_MG-2023]